MEIAENIIKPTLGQEAGQNSLKGHCQRQIREWKEFIISYLSQSMQERGQFLQELFDSVEEKIHTLPSGKQGGTELLSKHKDSMYQQIKSFYYKPDTSIFDELHRAWWEKAGEIAAQFPEKASKPQEGKRFYTQPEDRLFKILKFFKRWMFYFTRAHLYLLNVFRKKKSAINYWHHSPRLQGLFRHHFVRDFISSWMSLEDKTEKEFCQLVMKIKKWEETACIAGDSFEAPYPGNAWSALQVAVTEEVETWFENTGKSFEKDLELSGTMEYADWRLGNRFLGRRIRSETKKWNKNHRNWGNTLHALFEDWRSDLELSGLQHYISHNAAKLVESFTQWGLMLKDAHLEPILAFLSESKNKFIHLDKKESVRLITQIKYQIKKKLDQEMIRPLQETLSKNLLLNQIDKTEHLLQKHITSLEQKHTVIKAGNYNKALEPDELQTVSNLELISFEIQPWYEERFDVIKNELLVSVNELLLQAGDVDEVVAFSLNAASETLKGGGADFKECEDVIIEGFNRAYEKIKDVDRNLEEVLNKCSEELATTLENLKIRIHELTETENVSAMRLRISKAKAIRQSLALKDRLLLIFRNLYRKLSSKAVNIWTRLHALQKRITERLIPSASSAVPSRDISDFLSESDKIIENLPLIYRRLYAMEPLTDPMLFEGREQEVQAVNRAYDHWQQGSFGSVLITGEKWSGLTSLVNYLLSQNKFSFPVFRHVFKGNIIKPGDLYNILSELLNNDTVQSSEQLITYLNNSDKKVIILEDLQHLYLRKMNGLKALMEMIEIITSTHKQVFWIVTLSSYACQYLEKSIQISAYFSYPVSLEGFTGGQISDLVIKRNRISGFRIIFEAGEADLRDKKFQRLDEQGKQEYLKKRFFKQLNNFAQQNVSMALMYWLLSTRKVTKNTIVISLFKKPDLSFLLLLSAERIFALHSLILHDGLDVSRMSDVLSLPPQKVHMLLLAMEEDGILNRDQEMFMINPLVYRSVVQLLKSKNLIY